METLNQPPGEAIFVVGLQYGDEGKGKIVDMLASQADVVVRGNGGANAGHQIVKEGEGDEPDHVIALHQVPSGIKYPTVKNVIAHGVLVDPVELKKEINEIAGAGIVVSPQNLAISSLARMVSPKNKEQDAAKEQSNGALGSTKKGIAFAASDKCLHQGLRVESAATKRRGELAKIAYNELRREKTRKNFLGIMRPTKRKDAKRMADEFARAAKELVPFIQDTPPLLNGYLKDGLTVVVEGAQAFGLDPTHGKDPYTTSTGTTVPALIEGTSIDLKYISKRIGIFKATASKVGGGAFVTEIKDEEVANCIRGNKGEVDGEFGATSGRPREVGYLDLVMLKRAIQINGIDELVITKFDCIKRFGLTTKVAIAYEKETTDIFGNTVKEIVDTPPSSNDELLKCQPVFSKDFPTWENDQSPEAQNYLNFIEKYLKTPIKIVSNGPGRDEIIYRS